MGAGRDRSIVMVWNRAVPALACSEVTAGGAVPDPLAANGIERQRLLAVAMLLMVFIE